MMLRKSFFGLLFACFCATSYAQISISNVTSTPQALNVLRYEVSFSTNQAAHTFVEFGWQDGADSLKYATNVDAVATNHQFTLLGLVAGKNYRYRALAFDSTGCFASAWANFTTAALPSGTGIVDHLTVTTTTAGPGGFLLTNTRDANPERFLQMYDRRGHLVWYEQMLGDAAANLDGPCQHFNYDPHSNSIFLTQCDQVTEMAFDGSILHTISLTNTAPEWMAHHDVVRNHLGNLLVLAAKMDTVDKSSVGGDANALVVGPGILEYSPSGNLVWSWSAFAHKNPLYSPNPGGNWVPKFGPQAIDWLGANSVYEDDDLNYMMTWGTSNDIMKIDNQFSSIAWECGPHGFIDILIPDSFAAPHSLGLSRLGYYLTFDNRGLDSLSRVIEWWIDFGYTTPLMKISWEYALPAADFSPEDGNATRLSNGNILIGAGNAGNILEVTDAGSLLWRGEANAPLYRAFWVEDLYPRVHPSYIGDSLVCLSTDSVLKLVASPPGGVWSGPFVHGDTFDAALAGPGHYNITYKWGPESVSTDVYVDESVNCGVALPGASTPNLSFTAFPNPYSDHLNLLFDLKAQEDIWVEGFALNGQLRFREALGLRQPGKHQVLLDSENLGKGPLLIVLRTVSGNKATKIVTAEK
jgi:hypothetical protein